MPKPATVLADEIRQEIETISKEIARLERRRTMLQNAVDAMAPARRKPGRPPKAHRSFMSVSS
jgi:chaperonin cofactor prefoldin